MKKLIYLFIIFLLGLPTIANENTILNAGISFDWVNKSQLERDENIEKIRSILYSKSIIVKYPKKEFKEYYKDYLKDKKCNQHIVEIMNGKNENKTEKLAGFYTAGDKILYAYGIQYKNNIYTTYYYDTLGNLRYIDKMSENYPNFPYYTHQYRITGALAGSFYFTAYDTQYEFKSGKFKGLWYKDTMFNANAKKIMTRTNY